MTRGGSRLAGVLGAVAVGTLWSLATAGPDWTPMDSGTTDALRGVWGSGRNDVLAVGAGGTILRYDGSVWSVDANDANYAFYDVWGSGANDVFVVGGGGAILRYDGSAWSPMDSNTTADVYGVWGSGPNDVFAADLGGSIRHYDGASWSHMVNAQDLLGVASAVIGTGVWGSGPNDVFAVGYELFSGNWILHYDGSSWSVMDAWTADALWDVWGSGPNDVFAVGGAMSSAVLHYDGATWSSMTAGLTGMLTGVWGSGPNDVFAVGSGGSIGHYDGSTWSQMDSNTTADLWGVWGGGPDVFAVGNDGTILRHVSPVHNVTQDTWHTTVQDAIDLATDGDEIVLARGTYTGDGNRDIDFLGKRITVRSTDPNDPNVVAATVIDCGCGDYDPYDPNTWGEFHRGFYFHSGEDSNSVVAGLTIIDGFATGYPNDAGPNDPSSYGGGICCWENSSPAITACTINGCEAHIGGDGIYCGPGSNPTITGCTISGAGGGGWGLRAARRRSPIALSAGITRESWPRQRRSAIA